MPFPVCCVYCYINRLLAGAASVGKARLAHIRRFLRRHQVWQTYYKHTFHPPPLPPNAMQCYGHVMCALLRLAAAAAVVIFPRQCVGFV